MSNVIQMPLKAENVVPLFPALPKKRTIYVKRVSVQQIRKLMELGYTVVLR